MRESLAKRLATGEKLLLDGGTGSEIQRRGVGVSRGYDAKGNIGPWSSVANITAPDVVRQVHSDYLAEGADIVTTNTFYGSGARMAVAGLQDRWEEYNRRAVELAFAARDAVNAQAYVVGGIAPSPGPVDSYDDLRAHSELLADAGVDGMLTEYLGTVEKVRQAVRAAAHVGLPLLIGLCHFTEDGRLSADGGTMEQVVAVLSDEDVRVDAILLMCSRPEQISQTLPRLRAAFDGPIGAYANVGYVASENATGDDPGRELRAFDVGDNTPDRYADFGKEWLGMGAQIVGGCCATTPDHIAALRPVVKGA